MFIALKSGEGCIMWRYIIIGLAVLAGVLILIKIIYNIIKRKYIGKNKPGNEGDEDYQGIGYEPFSKQIELAGYKYDPEQDIFYSVLNPWQKRFGYCRLYDENMALFSMIVDCEPIFFRYDGKDWMIEFWKGQYGMVTGGEIGVYIKAIDLNIPGLIDGSFYYCSDELIDMSFALRKNGKILFTRSARHWWLTGFKLAEFSEPWELSMDIRITLKDRLMCDAFLKGLINAGYYMQEITRRGNTLYFRFDEPRTEQPITRTKITDWIIQRKNEYLCNKYKELTKGYYSIKEKIEAIKEKSPQIYNAINNIGKNKNVYEGHEEIENYIRRQRENKLYF